MKKILTMMCFVLHAIWLAAQPSFTVSCPDTVIVGTEFVYKITLTARSYKETEQINFGYHLQIVSYNYNQNRTTIDDKPYNTLTMFYKLRPTSMGRISLPQVHLKADGELVASPATQIEVKPENEYRREYERAFSLLAAQGVQPDSLHLRHYTYGRSISVFTDDISNCFAAVVSTSHAKLVDGLDVLAWSTESGMHSIDKNGPEWVFQNYRVQLDKLANGTSQLYAGSGIGAEVRPLLGGTAWGQRAPYNSFCPVQSGGSRDSQVAGCGAVALGQVMMHYKYPNQGKGFRSYLVNKKLYQLDLNAQQFDWSMMRDRYSRDESDSSVIKPIARLIVSAGVAAGADFGDKATSTSMSLYRSALVNNFGYSPKVRWLHGGTTAARIQTAANELQAGRPVVVSGGNHAFVADGFSGDFMHFNMGWEGVANGWYRTLVADNGELAFADMVVDIAPAVEIPQMAKTVNVEEAGTLASLLADDEVDRITHLTVTGKLNNADVRLLRRMAGGAESDTCWNTARGCLQHLDLSEANFETDRDGFFLRTSASGYKARYTTTRLAGEANQSTSQTDEFDFSKMTSELWEKFKSMKLDQRDGYHLTEEDGQYYICYHTQSDLVGSKMWSGCERLQEIVVPAGVTAIGDFAFGNCTSLHWFDIPEMCKAVGKDVFSNCYAIEGVSCGRQDVKGLAGMARELNKVNPAITGVAEQSGK